MRLLRSVALALVLGSALLPFAAEPSRAQVVVSVRVAPPLLPVYTQPPIPGYGYLWVPGYWAWADDDYYWVPGYWSRPPRVGLLWTPGYWGWNDGVYVFHRGYWGRTVGFYGGVSYGFGYTGVGFAGGYWRGGSYYYNRSVNNVGVNITNVYERPVTVVHQTNVSYNGGQGGVAVRPTPAQLAAASKGVPPTEAQLRHASTAATDPTLRSKANQGRPPVTAVPTPAAGAHALPTQGPAGTATPAAAVKAPVAAGAKPAAVVKKPVATGVRPATVGGAAAKAPTAATAVGKAPSRPAAVVSRPARPAVVRPSAPPRAQVVRPARPQAQAVRPAQRPQAAQPRRRLPGE